jgi:hypothetical protein
MMKSIFTSTRLLALVGSIAGLMTVIGFDSLIPKTAYAGFFDLQSVSCAAKDGYPLGRWEVGTRSATPATYSNFITFITSTSGTWLPSSGKGSFETSVAPAPGKAVAITLRAEGSTYKSDNQLVVSADGCRMTGTFLDSEGHRGEAIYRWQGVQ